MSSDPRYRPLLTHADGRTLFNGQYPPKHGIHFAGESLLIEAHLFDLQRGYG